MGLQSISRAARRLALLAYLAVTGQSSQPGCAGDIAVAGERSKQRARRTAAHALGAQPHLGGRLAGGRPGNSPTEHRINDLTTGKSFWLDVADFQGKLKICESPQPPRNCDLSGVPARPGRGG